MTDAECAAIRVRLSAEQANRRSAADYLTHDQAHLLDTDLPALLGEVERLRAELAVWEAIREPAYLWADCKHALMYGDMFPDEQGESYSDAYDARDEIEGDLYDAVIAHIPADWTPTPEQAPWRPEYHEAPAP